MMLIHKKLSYFIPCYAINKTILNSPSHYYLLNCLLQFSTSLSQNPSPKTHFMVNYLINSCGFSLDNATKASKYLTHLESPEKPDSVLQFLKQQGFEETHIRSLILCHPRVLKAKVEETLEPNIKALQNIGFSNSQLIQLIVSNPHALNVRNIVPKIKFWKTFLSDENHLLKVFMKNRDIIKYDISKCIAPKISLLQNYGFSDNQIVTLMRCIRSFMTRSIDSMEILVKRTEEFGFHRESRAFVDGLIVVSSIPEVTFQSKIELFKNYGWSESEFLSAFRKASNFAKLSKKNIEAKMDFLVEKAGCQPSYIAFRPVLLGLSLEKRLVPRYYVMQILKTKGLLRKQLDLATIMTPSDKMFVERFICSYIGQVPELHETYNTVYAGRIPISDEGIKEKLKHPDNFSED